ncbi:hypothetical protein K402DRAFT_225707 [Aulographum hederae CBS 113979]|uniref:Uncharacterized protein n=1 Tax=Aulographum hederae CBS 113979 TaxID=1176131 RepID=A0A6G1HB38_9PEZI|nr:hypothetical protein K402DRAFT_225707 [Aulographum hederae CBS 113979]
MQCGTPRNPSYVPFRQFSPHSFEITGLRGGSGWTTTGLADVPLPAEALESSLVHSPTDTHDSVGCCAAVRPARCTRPDLPAMLHFPFPFPPDCRPLLSSPSPPTQLLHIRLLSASPVAAPASTSTLHPPPRLRRRLLKNTCLCSAAPAG